jgi:uncharacterized protein (TIGR03000 family)
VKWNLKNLKETLETGIPSGLRDDARVLSGDADTADNILSEVDKLEVDPGDTVFCYYSGHGGYDPAHSDGDPSGGHLFQIPSGDLLRKTLFDKLKTKGARLTVLISDTCNVRTVANVKLTLRYASPPPNNPILRSLLLNQSGLVDISGSSRDQYGWFSQDGGWFTVSLQKVLCDPARFGGQAVSWNQALDAVSDETSALFKARKAQIVNSPGQTPNETLDQLKGQDDQRPQAFQLDVRAAALEASYAPAQVIVRTTEGARLYFNDKLTTQATSTRSFVTPPLPAGTEYHYTVRIEVNRGGEILREERRIPVHAGETALVDFTPSPVAGRPAPTIVTGTSLAAR